LETIKQQQVASLIHEALSDVFLKSGRDYYGNNFVTISKVRMTPDLFVARVYLSAYNAANKQAVVDEITACKAQIRFALGNKIKNAMRRMPDLEFYVDDTFEEMDKVNDIFRKIENDQIDKLL
jgi:ribosome-binding factor A